MSELHSWLNDVHQDIQKKDLILNTSKFGQMERMEYYDRIERNYQTLHQIALKINDRAFFEYQDK
jgi:hypothetical protein